MTAEAWADDASVSASEVSSAPTESHSFSSTAATTAADAAAYHIKNQRAGLSSYDSTMTAFEAEMAVTDMM